MYPASVLHKILITRKWSGKICSRNQGWAGVGWRPEKGGRGSGWYKSTVTARKAPRENDAESLPSRVHRCCVATLAIVTRSSRRGVQNQGVRLSIQDPRQWKSRSTVPILGLALVAGHFPKNFSHFAYKYYKSNLALVIAFDNVIWRPEKSHWRFKAILFPFTALCYNTDDIGTGNWHKRYCIRDPVIGQFEEVRSANFQKTLSLLLIRAV